MPRILKSNYENAIARHTEARKLRANRTKYPPPSRVTMKELVTITNKFKIGVGERASAKPLISQRKIQNQKNLNRFRIAKNKRAVEFKNAVAQKRRAATIQKKEMDERKQKIKKVNKLMTEIVKNIQTKTDLNYVMNNLFNESQKKKKVSGVAKKTDVKKGKGKGSKLFAARKRAAKQKAVVITNVKAKARGCPMKKLEAERKAYFKKVNTNKNAAMNKAKATAIKVMKAHRAKQVSKHPNYNNPNVLLPGELWGNHMNRLNKIKKNK